MSNNLRRDGMTLENWRLHPVSRYSFQHVSEFVPVAMVTWPEAAQETSPGPAVLEELVLNERDGSKISCLAHMQRSYTDSNVVLRDGELVAEWHADGVNPALPHLLFSVSKSITGMLAGIATGEGKLDPDLSVATYVPSMVNSTYGTARVRDLLDMTVDLDFDEEYLDDGGAFDRYRRAMLWNPERANTQPETMEALLATLGGHGRGHGHQFYYASPNTDLLGLVVERATGMRYHQYMAEKLWRPMGANGAAYVTLDRIGTARAAGGVCVTTRDLARLGQLVLDDGRNRDGAQIVPQDWIEDMRQNGNRQAWLDGNFAEMFANGRYRSCWYDVGDGRGTIAGLGIHGQWLWCDPISRVVIAKTSCHPEPNDDAVIALEIIMLGQIARAFAQS